MGVSRYNWKKWVSKTSRKRFAYPTKEEALENYIKRTEKRLKILEWQVEECKIGIMLAKAKKDEIQSTRSNTNAI